MTTSFAVVRKQAATGYRLNLPGKHNVLNALAAIAVATACNVLMFLFEALADFSGISRRFQVLGNYSGWESAHGS